jgi:hypothetical protein
MKPTDWYALSTEEKKDAALALANSMRGKTLLGRALAKAVAVMSKGESRRHSEMSKSEDVQDTEMLGAIFEPFYTLYVENELGKAEADQGKHSTISGTEEIERIFPRHRPKIAICPYPLEWIRIHRQLLAEIEKRRRNPLPPEPMALGHWDYSNDQDKQRRWLETLFWAWEYGLLDILRNMPPESMYMVDEISAVRMAPDFGPSSDYSYHEPKPRPASSEITRLMNHLRSAWMEIVGPEIGAVTSPKRFTGKKRRRLVVSIDEGAPRPSYSYASRGKLREPFRRFRAAVNAAIEPHHVDHIDFVVAKDQTA